MSKSKDKIPDMGFDEVELESVEWLIPGLLPLGNVVALCGGARSGKSTFAAACMAHLTGGDALSAGIPQDKPCKVAWFTKEESAQSQVGPRLLSAGCQMKFVRRPGYGPGGQRAYTFSFPSGLEALENYMIQGRIKMVFFDPIRSFMDRGCDPNGDEMAVRGLMEGVIEVCQRQRATAVMTMHHRKDMRGDALSLISGSAAWGQTVRVAIQFAKHPDGVRRVMSFAKFSLGPEPPSRMFRIESGILGPRFLLGETCDLSADDASMGMLDSAAVLELADGLDWLRGRLQQGKQETKAVYQGWLSQGYSRNGWWRARKELGVKVARDGVPGEEQRTLLYLPENTGNSEI